MLNLKLFTAEETLHLAMVWKTVSQ